MRRCPSPISVVGSWNSQSVASGWLSSRTRQEASYRTPAKPCACWKVFSWIMRSTIHVISSAGLARINVQNGPDLTLSSNDCGILKCWRSVRNFDIAVTVPVRLQTFRRLDRCLTLGRTDSSQEIARNPFRTPSIPCDWIARVELGIVLHNALNGIPSSSQISPL
jgi:hypothetical protein